MSEISNYMEIIIVIIFIQIFNNVLNPLSDGSMEIFSKISSTITIVKNPAGKGTIIIRSEPGEGNRPDESDSDTLKG